MVNRPPRIDGHRHRIHRENSEKLNVILYTQTVSLKRFSPTSGPQIQTICRVYLDQSNNLPMSNYQEIELVETGGTGVTTKSSSNPFRFTEIFTNHVCITILYIDEGGVCMKVLF